MQFILNKLNYFLKNVALKPHGTFVPIYPYLVSNKWRETKSFELVTDTATKLWLRKHVTKNEHLRRKWTVEFLSKIARFNLIRNDQIYQFTLISYMPLPLDDVIKRTRFLMSSTVTIQSCLDAVESLDVRYLRILYIQNMTALIK